MTELFGGEAYYHDDLGRPYRFCRYGERCTYAHPGDFVRISSRKAYEVKQKIILPAAPIFEAPANHDHHENSSFRKRSSLP